VKLFFEASVGQGIDTDREDASERFDSSGSSEFITFNLIVNRLMKNVTAGGDYFLFHFRSTLNIFRLRFNTNIHDMYNDRKRVSASVSEMSLKNVFRGFKTFINLVPRTSSESHRYKVANA